MKKILKSGYVQLLMMLSITIVSQGISLIKGSITASIFGTTMQMDAFNLSNSIATFLFSFIGVGITTILIPNLVKKTDRKAVNTFLSVLYSISLFCIVLAYLFRGILLTSFAHGNVAYLSIASSLLLTVLITQMLMSINQVITAYFQADNKHVLPQIVNLSLNGLLLLLILFNRNIDIETYANYILISASVNLLIQYVMFKRHHYSFALAYNLKNPAYKTMVKTFIPTLFSAGLYQVTLVTDSLISSSLGEGEISKLTYSNTIITMINNLFVHNLMNFIYPKIIRNITDKKNLSFLIQYMVLFFAIMMYVASAFMIGGRFAISLIYQRGSFTGATTNIVYICVMIYLVGIPFNIMREIMYRYFYTLNDTLTPFKNSILASILNFVVSIVLARYIGLFGVVFGTALTNIYSFTTIAFRARKHLTFKDYLKLSFECFKVVVVVGISFMLFHSMSLFLNVYINFFVMEILNALVFIIGLFIVRSTVLKVRL